MIQSSKVPCNFSCGELSGDASPCRKCARNLLYKLDLLQQPCRVVPDGNKFGVWYKGEIRIHRLSLENAQTLVAFMNSALREEDTNKDLLLKAGQGEAQDGRRRTARGFYCHHRSRKISPGLDSCASRRVDTPALFGSAAASTTRHSRTRATYLCSRKI